MIKKIAFTLLLVLGISTVSIAVEKTGTAKLDATYEFCENYALDRANQSLLLSGITNFSIAASPAMIASFMLPLKAPRWALPAIWVTAGAAIILLNNRTYKETKKVIVEDLQNCMLKELL